MINATPTQLIFGRNLLFDVSFRTKWREIGKKRIDAIDKNIANENRKRVQYKHNIEDKALLEKGKGVKRKFYSRRTGPYEVIKIYQTAS